MAARYEDPSLSLSKAVAFSNAIIGIHWPEVPQENFDNLARLANANPNLVFQFFGGNIGQR